MTKTLVKLFVKDYENKEESGVRARYGMLVSVVGVICNIILCLTKIIIGYLISSISVMSDGFNNLSDAASSVISFIGTKVSVRPADKEHPFGHGRAEYISAFIVAFLVVQVGITCFTNAIKKIFSPEEVIYNKYIIYILIASVLVKLWLAFFNRKIGKEINSNVMKAVSVDAFGDSIITISTIISIVIGYYTKIVIDGYMGLVISVFVIISGVKIAKETMEPLLGEAIDKDIYTSIIDKIEKYEGVIGVHDLILHNYGPSKAMATVHVEFPSDVSLPTAHEVVDKIEKDILEELNIPLVIHVDPVDTKDKEYDEIRKSVILIVKSIEEKASIHDLRLVREYGQIRIIFDMILPFDYNEEESKVVKSRIKQQLKEINVIYHPLITVEHGFVSE